MLSLLDSVVIGIIIVLLLLLIIEMIPGDAQIKLVLKVLVAVIVVISLVYMLLPYAMHGPVWH